MQSEKLTVARIKPAVMAMADFKDGQSPSSIKHHRANAQLASISGSIGRLENHHCV